MKKITSLFNFMCVIRGICGESRWRWPVDHQKWRLELKSGIRLDMGWSIACTLLTVEIPMRTDKKGEIGQSIKFNYSEVIYLEKNQV